MKYDQEEDRASEPQEQIQYNGGALVDILASGFWLLALQYLLYTRVLLLRYTVVTLYLVLNSVVCCTTAVI